MKKILFLVGILIVVNIVALKYNLFSKGSNNTPSQTILETSSPITTNSTKYPYIGIRFKMIDKQTAQLNQISEGAYITQVIDSSPASKSGLLEEDIIIEFEGKKIDTSDSQALTKLISEKTVGEKIALKIWRNKEIINVFVIPEANK